MRVFAVHSKMMVVDGYQYSNLRMVLYARQDVTFLVYFSANWNCVYWSTVLVMMVHSLIGRDGYRREFRYACVFRAIAYWTELMPNQSLIYP